MSSLRDRLRILSFSAAGILAGALFVAPGVTAVSAPAPAETTQMRVASCQGLNFHPITADTGYHYRNDRGVFLYRTDAGRSDDPDGFFLCDPALPHRAVVTTVQFTVYDGVETSEVRYCALYRAGLNATNADDGSQLMAQVGTTGMAQKPGVVRKTTSSIAHATIDNANWAYTLQCQIYFPSGTSTNGVGIYGASVTYQISSTNG